MASGVTPEQKRQLETLLAKHEKRIRDAFLLAVEIAHERLDFDALVEAIENNDIARAAELLRIDNVALFPLQEAIRAAFIEAGMTVTVPRAIAGGFGFNGRHRFAERIIAETGARLVTEMGNPGTEILREIILDGAQKGIGAQKVARQLGGVINPKTGKREGGVLGLDAPRAERAWRVRAILSDPSRIADYFLPGGQPRYKSTDRRFDALVRRAIKEGKALPAADVERIARAHEARLLKARAQTVSLNESFTATAAGRYEAFRQMLESGVVEKIDKTWSHNTLKNPRHDHQATNGVTKPLAEPFIMADGTPMQFPHDPAGGAKHSISCRCVVVYKPQFKRPK
jgi:ketosteroid isomerase-like protein